MGNTKICSSKEHKGGRELSIEFFHKDKSSSDGIRNKCVFCARKEARDWRKIKAQDPNWRKRFNDANTKSRKKGGKIHQLLHAARDRARKKGLEFSLTKEDIVIPLVCPILGIPIIPGHGRKSDTPKNKLVGAMDCSPSVDRINNDKGYTKDNIRIISWRANYLKNNATLQELILLGEDAKKLTGIL